MRRHALLITACPRSGATALAGALAHAGAAAGRTFVAAPPNEPAATWQCAPLVALNERLLDAIGLRWDSLVAPPDRWGERSAVKPFAAQADALIANEYRSASHALLHDPRLSLTAPFWRERLEVAGFDVCAAIVARRPAEVAASLSKREPFAPEKTLSLWLHYLTEAERGTRGMPRTLVTYDRLLDAPAGVLSHVVSECRFGLKIERTEREAALTAIRPDLKHFGDERPLSAGALASGIDRALDEGYRRLAALSPGTDPKGTIEAIAQQAYIPLTHALPPWLASELANGRVHAERQAELLAEARAELAAREASTIPALRARQTHDCDEALVLLRRDVGRIADALADQPAREQALRVELMAAQRDLEDERATISRLSQALEQERTTAEAQAGKLALAQEHFRALVAEVEQARADEHTWTEHNASLAHELDQARDALHAMQSQRDALRKERDEATRQLERFKTELESARTDLKIVDHDRTALAARAQVVDHAVVALREELTRRAAAEATLVGERDRLACELRAQSGRLSALESDLARRAAELASLSGHHDMMRRTLAALERSWIGRKALAGTRRAAA